MDKELIEVEIDYKLDWVYGVDIKTLRKDLDEIERLGATYVAITPIEEYGCAYVSIQAIVERMETDEEFEQRLKKIKEREESTKRNELFILKKLKEKYGEN